MPEDTMSETDVRIFTELSNPIKTNTDLLRKEMTTSSSIPDKIVEEREADAKWEEEDEEKEREKAREREKEREREREGEGGRSGRKSLLLPSSE